MWSQVLLNITGCGTVFRRLVQILSFIYLQPIFVDSRNAEQPDRMSSDPYSLLTSDNTQLTGDVSWRAPTDVDELLSALFSTQQLTGCVHLQQNTDTSPTYWRTCTDTSVAILQRGETVAGLKSTTLSVALYQKRMTNDCIQQSDGMCVNVPAFMHPYFITRFPVYVCAYY